MGSALARDTCRSLTKDGDVLDQKTDGVEEYLPLN